MRLLTLFTTFIATASSSLGLAAPKKAVTSSIDVTTRDHYVRYELNFKSTNPTSDYEDQWMLCYNLDNGSSDILSYIGYDDVWTTLSDYNFIIYGEHIPSMQRVYYTLFVKGYDLIPSLSSNISFNFYLGNTQYEYRTIPSYNIYQDTLEYWFYSFDDADNPNFSDTILADYVWTQHDYRLGLTYAQYLSDFEYGGLPYVTLGNIGYSMIVNNSHPLTDLNNIKFVIEFTPYNSELLYNVTTDATQAYDEGHQEGYDNGYTDGQADGYADGRQDGLDQGYENGYHQGELHGISIANDYSFFSLFGAIADTPVLMIRNLFNFDFFGINLLTVVLSLFTGLILFYLFRKLI